MRIQSTQRRTLAKPKMAAFPKSGPSEASAAKAEESHVDSSKTPAWRAITLNEAVVEIPQSLLELSKLNSKSPIAAQGAQAGVAGLALLRSVQCFHDAHSLEEIMEGVSSGALAVAGAATLLPFESEFLGPECRYRVGIGSQGSSRRAE